jgi:hypothetical protein
MTQQFILLLHEDPAVFASVSPAQMQAIVAKYVAWSQQLGAEGRIAAGHKLEDGTGRLIRAGSVTDGPYAETKEIIGGLFIINASGYDDAVAIAKTCPHCEFGTVEVRRIEQT